MATATQKQLQQLKLKPSQQAPATPPKAQPVVAHVIEDPALEAKAVATGAKLHATSSGSTALELKRDTKHVHFALLTPSEGLGVSIKRVYDFDRIFTAVPNYPVVKACRKYLAFATRYGATDDALGLLGRVITISQAEMEAIMAAKKAVAEGKTKMTDEAKAKLKEAKANAPPKEKKPRASNRFQELIMEHKLTDPEIFKKVQAEFGLDDNKAGYVKWYRNHMKKTGKNPPDCIPVAKEPKEEKAPKEAKPAKK